jgi:Flp pilus assembly protein TadG
MLFRRPTNELHGKTSKRRGVAAAEFALVCPILAMLFLGMTEMSRMLMVKVALNNAARKGCQTGTLAAKSNSDITSDVTDVMRDNGFTAALFNPPTVGTMTITITDPNGNTVTDALNAPPDSTVSVNVTIPVSSTAWVTSSFLSRSASQAETVVMKKQ